MKLDKLITLQLRPHVAAMLDAYITQVRERLPENVRAKITRSLIVRKLIARTPSAAALAYVGNRRFRDHAAVQLRVRCTEGEFFKARTREQPTAKVIAALIVDAMYPDGNYPVNPDTNTDPTKDTA